MKYLALPLLSLILPQTAIFTRIIRSSLLEAATENFIKTAQSKGLSPLKVLLKHIFPYAQIPIITIVGLQIPLLITGVILIEYVFFLPGMGRLILQSYSSKRFDFGKKCSFITYFACLLCELNYSMDYFNSKPR